jgi:error-prone DNA polymerase
VKRLTEIFGRQNVYVELQRHFHRDEEYRNRVAIEIAEALQLPLLATNGVNYATPRERELADAFTALQHHRTLATAGRLLARNAERYLKSPAAMRALFADVPQAIANTLELSSRLEFTLNDLGYEFPRYPVPEGETMMSFLRERTREGMQSRYGRADAELKKRARRQIERELNLIEHLKLAGYFLIVWDLVRFAANRTFWCRAADRPPTARFATRSASRRWIRSAWNYCLNDFFPRNGASGPTSILICRAATSASA